MDKGRFCGILNVDKPPGMTSHDVVLAIRKWSGERKVGHAGTLDPLATGVLLVCIGRATRVSEYLMASPKEYLVGVRLGISTTTHDADGKVVHTAEVDVNRRQVEEAMSRFVGSISQVPPMYSAIKRGGRRLYELARQGAKVKLPPRQVEVYELRLLAWSPPDLQMAVRCGAGTYVRALVRDLGEVLGCGAHVIALRRTRSGRFTDRDAVPLERLAEAFESGDVGSLLYPLEVALEHLPSVRLDAADARRLAAGSWVECPAAPVEGEVRVYAPGGELIAVAFRDPRSGQLRPRKVFV